MAAADGLGNGRARAPVVARPRRKVNRMETDEEIERLRRGSPAYAVDDGWEAVLPPMGAELSVRFDTPTMRRLVSLASATQRTPSALIRDWTLERLVVIGSGTDAEPAHAVGESPAI